MVVTFTNKNSTMHVWIGRYSSLIRSIWAVWLLTDFLLGSIFHPFECWRPRRMIPKSFLYVFGGGKKTGIIKWDPFLGGSKLMLKWCWLLNVQGFVGTKVHCLGYWCNETCGKPTATSDKPTLRFIEPFCFNGIVQWKVFVNIFIDDQRILLLFLPSNDGAWMMRILLW